MWRKFKKKNLLFLAWFLIVMAIPIFAFKVPIANADTGQWVNSNEILVDGNTYTKSGANFVYTIGTATGGQACNDIINTVSTDFSFATLNLSTLNSQISGTRVGGVTEICNAGSSQIISLTNVGNATVAPNAGGSGSGATTSPSLNCSVDFNPLTWFICPIISAASGMISVLDNAITSLLDINCANFNATGSGANAACATPASPGANGYYKAWQSVRTIALGAVVIFALVMIISQALGTETFDAYSIRKILPRMLVAVIAISLSWQIIQFLVQASNDLGHGIRALIFEPFLSINGGNIQISQTGSSALALLGVGGIVSLSIIGLLTFVLAAAVAVFIAFALLTLRQIVIIFLAIFAPLAIAFFIFPGTQRVWKLWSDNFIKLLLMFPLIAGIIAMGRVFALVDTSFGTGLLQEITAIIAYFLPYFIIPLTFRWSGSLMSAASGFTNSIQTGLKKPLAGLRRKKLATNMQDLKTGRRFAGRDYLPGTNAVAGRLNRISRGIAAGPGKGFGFGERGAQGIDQVIRMTAAEKMKTPEWAAIQNSDNAMMAATYDTAAEAENALTDRFMLMNPSLGMAAARQQAVQAVRTVQASGNKFGDQALQFAAAEQMVSNGTGYQAFGGNTALEDMTETLARVSHGNTNTAAAIVGFSNSAAKQANRWDLAPGYSPLNNLVQGRVRELAGTGTGPTNQEYDTATVDAARSADTVTIMRGRPQQVENLTQALGSRLDQEWDAYNRAAPAARNDIMRQIMRTTSDIRQLDRVKGYGSDTNQQFVNDLMTRTQARRDNLRTLVEPTGPVDPASRRPTVNPANWMEVEWDRISATPQNPNDANLP